MRILGVDLSLIFSIKDAAEGGKVNGQAYEKTIAAVDEARKGFDRCVIATDSGASFRKVEPEYKADRTDRGEVYRAQYQRTIERLKAEGCTILTAPAVGTFPATGATSYAEADDVLGALAEWYSQFVGPLSEEATAEWSLAILSDDSDMEQLVDSSAGIYVLKTQTRGGERWDDAMVTAKRGVGPARIADLKAITGDKSDHYLGFCADIIEGTNPPKRGPGIGPAGAVSLLNKYGSALDVFDIPAGGEAAWTADPDAAMARADDRWKADAVPDAARALLRKHGRARAVRGLFLATIRRDLPGLDFNAILAEPVRTPITEPESIERAASWPKVEEPVVVAPPAPVAAPPSAPVVDAPVVSTALALPPPAALVAVDPSSAAWAMSLQPRTGEEAYHMAINLHVSKIFSKKFESPEAIWTVMLLGREHGLSMLAALQSMHMIEGKVEMSAELIVAKILRSGVAKYFTLVETDEHHATWETHRQGEVAPLRMSFSVKDAERRQIFTVKDGKRWTGNGKVSQWEKMPDVMCMWRCATKLARAKYPDVCRGLYGEGEIRETRSMRDGAFDADFEDAA
jgi:5'-3' exonuclease